MAGKRGRPAFEPTAEQRATVKMLTAFGIPQEHVCELVRHPDGKPIGIKTLHKYFRHELDTGEIEANAKVAGALYKSAVEDRNITAMIFWLKTRARWKESPQGHEFLGPDGKPQAIPTLADFYQTVAMASEPDPGDGD